MSSIIESVNVQTVENISLFIPFVRENISKDFIGFYFNKIGKVNNIDLILKIDNKGNQYQIAYIHFDNWFQNEYNINLQNNIKNLENGVTIYYDDSNYWKLFMNKAKKIVSGHRKQSLIIDEVQTEQSEHVLSFSTPEKKPLTNKDFSDMFKKNNINDEIKSQRIQVDQSTISELKKNLFLEKNDHQKHFQNNEIERKVDQSILINENNEDDFEEFVKYFEDFQDFIEESEQLDEIDYEIDNFNMEYTSTDYVYYLENHIQNLINMVHMQNIQINNINYTNSLLKSDVINRELYLANIEDREITYAPYWF